MRLHVAYILRLDVNLSLGEPEFLAVSKKKRISFQVGVDVPLGRK